MADQIAILNQGKIVERGQASSVVRDPQHPETRALLAAMPRLTFSRRAEGGA
jgi:peptide/nickel transport system ATP-binding protein